MYPEIEPYATHSVDVGDNHVLYVEEVGNKQGIPVIFIHGGPGGAISDQHRRFFNPDKYRVILFDQRGCGKSKPHASLESNTSQHLISDIETIRESMKIDKFILFGGSWGSTLSLLYAIHNPDKVLAMVLRGIFLCRQQEIEWFYGYGGTSRLFPDYWDDYMSVFPSTDEINNTNVVKEYYKLLTSNNKDIRENAALKWSLWEAKTATLRHNDDLVEHFNDIENAIAMARIECHYFVNRIFFPENFILNNANKLKNIPLEIVHGRYDVICPLENALDLKKSLPHANLHIIDAEGHSAGEKGIGSKLVSIMDNF